MANQSDITPGLVQELEQGLAAQQITFAMLALTVFDLVLCFPREVDLFWRQKLRLGSWLYILTRYCFLVFMFMSVLIPPDAPNCDTLVKVASAIDLVSAITGAVFAMTRAWALYKRKTWILVFYLLLYIPWLGMSLKILSTTTCSPPSESLAALTQLLLAFMNGISLILNLFIVVLTVNRTYSSVRTLGMDTLTGSDKQTMLSLLLYDGSIYFAVMLVADIMTTVTAYRAPPPLQSVGATIGAVFSVNLICRFLLDLRETVDPFHARDTLDSFDSNADTEITVSPSSIYSQRKSGRSSGRSKLDDLDDDSDDDDNGSLLWIRDLGAFPDYRAALSSVPPLSYQQDRLGQHTRGQRDAEKALPPIPDSLPRSEQGYTWSRKGSYDSSESDRSSSLV